MTDVVLRYLLSTPGQSAPRPTGVGRVYRKDVIRTGKYYVPQAKQWLDVTTDRIDQWVENFSRMQTSGVGVSFTTDHQRTADAKRGNISRLYRQGDTAVFEFEPPDEATETLIKRCPDVSLELEFNVQDGTGAIYDEAITAITATPDPVVPGQKPYELIAASRNKSGTILRLSTIYKQEPNFRSHTMTPEHLKKMQTVLGLKPESTEEETITAALERLEKAKKDAEDAKHAGGDNQKQELEDAKKEAADTKKELARLKAETIKLGRSPEIDPDALEAFSEARQAEIDSLVSSNRLTPASAKKLAPVLLGSSGNRPAVCLSTKAAAHAGLETPIAKAVLDALKENDPVLLAKIQGDRTGIQQVHLSRQNAGVDEYDPKVTKEMADKAFAGR